MKKIVAISMMVLFFAAPAVAGTSICAKTPFSTSAAMDDRVVYCDESATQSGTRSWQNVLADLGVIYSKTPTEFRDGDATPDVSDGAPIYITANTSSTTITDFDGESNGRVFLLIVGDTNTTFDFTSSGLTGKATDATPTAGELLIASYSSSDSKWHIAIPSGDSTGCTSQEIPYKDSSGNWACFDFSTEGGKLLGINSGGTTPEGIQTAYISEMVAWNCFDTSTTVSDTTGTREFVVPKYMDGWEVVDAIFAVHTTATGTFSVVILKNGSTIMSSNLSYGASDSYASVADGDGSFNSSSATVSQGDRLNWQVTSSSGTMPTGGTLTIVIQAQE